MSSSSPSAHASSFFGMSSRAASDDQAGWINRKHDLSGTAVESSTCVSSNQSDPDLLTEWTWTGYTANSKFIRGLSWGVSCLRTDCRENQDGWAVQVYACTDITPTPRSHFHPSFSFSWNHELTSLNSQLCGLLHSGDTVSLPLTPQTSAVLPKDPASTPPIAASKPSRQTYIGSSTFVVLDGHGAGGRDAAAAIEKAFDSVFSRTLLKNDIPRDPLNPISLLESVGESLRVGQKMIEKLNGDTQRDFGTTCVSVTLVNDLLISTACGDSSALLLAFPRGNWSSNTGTKKVSPLVVELSRRHNLEDKDELQRIVQEGKGKVIRGDGGVLRLIPGELEYDEAKRRGLSINMGRSMGHAIFSTCGLSTATDFSCLALKQIPKLLNSPPKVNPAGSSCSRVANRCFRLPPLNAAECRRVVESFIKSAEASALRRPKSEAGSYDRKGAQRTHAQGSHTLPHTQGSHTLAAAQGENAQPFNSPPVAAKSSDCSKPKSAVSFPERTKRSLFAKRDSQAEASADIHLEKRSTVPAFSARAAFIRCLARRLPPDSPTGGGGGGGGGAGCASVSDTTHTHDHRLKTKLSAHDTHNSPTGGVTSTHSTPKVGDMFLLLMSDGVTDVLSSSCIVEMVKDFDLKSKSRNRPFDPAAFSLALTEVARERRLKACQRADNCTCLAVHLIPE
eukprot:Gregarina_sp_Pseudo_9__145@NODE_109_length_4207_cov_15_727207_g101_i0_p1_GENE_NODE_109_length_4207_cov_15_727207_g101_i0NODE_109_length_4207_cov_15_727207_g101_i0_p1_ORF_typecomplete_len677_score109_71PP2C/PF00481_21/6e15PP2C/PF00481_21/0_00014PP2C_2/PF13672_6/1_9e05PP2C_2/PF13672_6/0_53_NODE_109_length_4207_cov_15_727207_g101_i01612191